MIDSRISELPRPFVLTAFDTMQQTRDEAYAFTQEANFYWLTHINESGWLVIGDEKDIYLVAPEKTPEQLLFEGGLLNDEAIAVSGINSILTSKEGWRYIENLAKKYNKIHTLGRDPYDKYNTFTRNPAPGRLRNRLKRLFKQVDDIRPEFTRLRAAKQPAEIEAMRRAIAITGTAFACVYKNLNQHRYKYEYEIEADMTACIRRSGADGHAYEPIIAGAKNALTMHYSKNNDILPKNGFILMDVGAKYNSFVADITRTYAVGEVSRRHQEVYSVLLDAHKAIIATLAPDVTYKDYQQKSDNIMKQALIDLGLLKDKKDEKTYRKYFPHAISHGLGLDVHESLGGDKFTTGMVLTVEPGIYIPEEGIGIRLEDNILITSDGHKNLSSDIPLDL